MGRFFALVACSLLAGCASGGRAPLRSPSLDYAPPAATTTDGETVGADRRGPSDKLHEGVSSDGPAPGWKADKEGLTFDPKQRVGGAVDPPPANGSSPSK
jgi:hypothetical protein